MIKLNDNYFISRDPNNWILTEKRYHVAKRGHRVGEIICDETPHYFGKLEQLCLRVLDMELDPSQDMEKLLASIHEAQGMIIKAIEKHRAEVAAMFKEA